VQINATAVTNVTANPARSQYFAAGGWPTVLPQCCPDKQDLIFISDLSAGYQTYWANGTRIVADWIMFKNQNFSSFEVFDSTTGLMAARRMQPPANTRLNDYVLFQLQRSGVLTRLSAFRLPTPPHFLVIIRRPSLWAKVAC